MARQQHGSGALGAREGEVDAASWEAARGAVAGAARWGLYSGLAAAAAFAFSPLYRGLTVQFKVFLQMSGMTFGSMVEADRRLRAHEVRVRRDKKIARDAEVWKRYERDYEAGGVAAAAEEDKGRARVEEMRKG
ncbi:hypothetical protein BJ546DRAFT_1002533 [Cryomyces antarcticus]|nr:hypothetical protein LTR04_001002 [Oleoguttula sp. CCFEE 6159]